MDKENLFQMARENGSTHREAMIFCSIVEDAITEEREACAVLAESHFIHDHTIAGPHFAAELAAKIRMRSNV